MTQLLDFTPEVKDSLIGFEALDVTGPSSEDLPNAGRHFFISHSKKTTPSSLYWDAIGWNKGAYILIVSKSMHVPKGANLDTYPGGVPAIKAPTATQTSEAVEFYTNISDAIQSARARSGLPATTVAHMVGLSRRALYKVIEEGSTSEQTEKRVRQVVWLIDRLFEQFGSPAAVRAALLTPLPQFDNRAVVDLGDSLDVFANSIDAFLDEDAVRAIETRRRRDQPLTRKSDDVTRLAKARTESE